jgi:hypothetical protein
MTTRINPNAANPSVDLLSTATRVTPQPVHPFGAVLRAGASDVLSGAQSAASALPGGSVIAAAIRGGTQGTALAASDGLATGASASPTLNNGAGTGNAAGNGSLENSLAKQAEDNLYYLGLQQRIQDENRHYTTVSNVLKAQHDTVKNSIGNLR